MSTRSAVAGSEHPGDAASKGLLTRRRFSVDEYYSMARAGILTEDERVELLDGEVVEMTPLGIRHAACVGRLDRAFARCFADRRRAPGLPRRSDRRRGDPRPAAEGHLA